MRALALLMAGSIAAQGAAARPVPLEIPAALLDRALETAVVCRDPRGAWSGVGAWSPLDDRSGGVMARNGCRVLLRPVGVAEYLASNAIRAFDGTDRLSFPFRWLRTARAAPASSQPYWVSAASPAAECVRTPMESLCMFVLADDPGVLVTLDESGLRFALSRADGSRDAAAWRAAAWLRLVRVRAPGGVEWSARVSVLEPALKHGRDLLRQARSSSAAMVHRLGAEAILVEGGAPEPGARLEIAAPGAATTLLDLSQVRGSPLTVLDLSLPPEEVIEGDVRSDGRVLDGATLSLMRFLSPSSGRKDDERPMERVGETRTDATGRFRFSRLSRGEYELTVAHPRRGRTRLAVRAPSVHRVTLTPHAIIRGRVVSHGVPVAGAEVTVLPSYEAVLTARNPAMLIGESVQTAHDGRFELVAPEEGRLMLTVLKEGIAARIDLGDARALPPSVDLADVRLDEPLDVHIALDLPASCVVSAGGPMDQPGILLRRAEWLGPGRWKLRSVLEGRWLLEASCDGSAIPLEPPMIEVNRRNELVRLTPRREPAVR